MSTAQQARRKARQRQRQQRQKQSTRPLGAATLDQVERMIRNNPLVKNVKQAQQEFRKITKKIGVGKTLDAINEGISFVNQNTVGGLYSEGVGNAANTAAKKAGVDKRVVVPLLMLTGMVRPGKGSGSGPLPKANRPHTGSQSSAAKAREARAKGRAVPQQPTRFPPDAAGRPPRISDADLRQPPASSNRARLVGRGQRDVVGRAIKNAATPEERAALQKFFSGTGTAETFPSRKGHDIRKRGGTRETGFDQELKAQVAAAFERTDASSIQKLGRPDGRAGRSGAIQAVSRSIQRERTKAGKQPLSKSQLADATYERILAYRQREQFNQLQAERRGGVELPSPRDAKKGERSKPAADRKRPENIPGGERIPQSKPEQARRARERERMKRAAQIGRSDPKKRTANRGSNVPAPDPRRQQRMTKRVLGNENPGVPQGGAGKTRGDQRPVKSVERDEELAGRILQDRGEPVDTTGNLTSRQSDASRPPMDRAQRAFNRGRGGAKAGEGGTRAPKNPTRRQRPAPRTTREQAQEILRRTNGTGFRPGGEVRGVQLKAGPQTNFKTPMPERQPRSKPGKPLTASELNRLREQRRRRRRR